ncbi:MAG: sigma-54-dependent Fis family transcriptional regulator [Bacteroidaceae bacterium]|nr:sigma-54-dependent Fis family transcriptional regulator [Bacteroidaceae bacterium]
MKKFDLQEIKNRYGIVGRDEGLNTALSTALQVAGTNLSVLIQGESGVGKESIPRIIHDNSQRRSKRYLAINCGSIPEGTIDSELFGHEKGAYTGAIGEREGYFGAANGGTLFLDEVGELPLSTQARLLRVLESGEYIRVGSNEPRKTDVRIVAATNVDIPIAIREGRFREDLYYRLCTINIKMPPLRDRGGDTVLIFKKFALDTAAEYHMMEPIRLTSEGEEVVKSYKWPGNIRQLKNIVEQMSILCQDRSITPADLEKYGVVPNLDETTSISRISGPEFHRGANFESNLQFFFQSVVELRKEVDELKARLNAVKIELPKTVTTIQPISHSMADQSQIESAQEYHVVIPQDTPKHTHVPMAEEITAEEAEEVEDENLNIFDMEKRNIIKALERNRYRRKLAAKELGISERTLYRKIKDYGIED